MVQSHASAEAPEDDFAWRQGMGRSEMVRIDIPARIENPLSAAGLQYS